MHRTAERLTASSWSFWLGVFSSRKVCNQCVALSKTPTLNWVCSYTQRFVMWCMSVNSGANQLMQKTGMSLRHQQPQPRRVFHWLVYADCQVCLLFSQEALTCSGAWDAVWGLHLFLSGCFLTYTREGTASPVPCLGVLHPASSDLMDMHSVDSGESLCWRVCPAFGFCTVCVEQVCFFSLCFHPCRGMQGFGFDSGAGCSPGHSVLVTWGHGNCFC